MTSFGQVSSVTLPLGVVPPRNMQTAPEGAEYEIQLTAFVKFTIRVHLTTASVLPDQYSSEAKPGPRDCGCCAQARREGAKLSRLQVLQE